MAANDSQVTSYVLEKGIANEAQIKQLQSQAKSSNSSLAQILLNAGKLTSADLAVLDNGRTPSTLQSGSIEKSINNILEYGVKARASHIHIEPKETEIQIRYRIDGTLQQLMHMPKSSQAGTIKYLKKIAGIPPGSDLPSEGHFDADFGKRPIVFQVSTLPTALGEKIFIRIIDASVAKNNLSDLGLQQTTVGKIVNFLNGSNGVLMVASPDATDTTSILYAILRMYDPSKYNIVTVENPIMLELPGVNQTELQSERGYNFPTAISATLKQSPNVIMVNDILDSTSAELLIDASLSNQVVIAGSHARDSISAVLRLSDMKVERFLIASTIKFVISTRSVRRLCPTCRKRYVPSGAELARLTELIGPTVQSSRSSLQSKSDASEMHKKKVIPAPSREELDRRSILDKIAADPNIINRSIDLALGWDKANETKTNQATAPAPTGPTYYQAVGCSQCSNTGYIGQINLFEFLEVNDTVAAAITAGKTHKELQAEAKKSGFISLAEDAHEKAREGITSLSEILRVL